MASVNSFPQKPSWFQVIPWIKAHVWSCSQSRVICIPRHFPHICMLIYYARGYNLYTYSDAHCMRTSAWSFTSCWITWHSYCRQRAITTRRRHQPVRVAQILPIRLRNENYVFCSSWSSLNIRQIRRIMKIFELKHKIIFKFIIYDKQIFLTMSSILM